LSVEVGDVSVEIVDFRYVPTHCKFLALMPQWDFLDFLVAEAKRYPTFRLRMDVETNALIEEDGRIAGLRARTKAGPLLEVRADLVVGADGRHSTVRAQAGLEVLEIGAPIDVLWLRLSRRQGDPAQPTGHIEGGRMLVLFNRRDYWQIAFVIPKGGFDPIRAEGLPRFRETLAASVSWLGDRVEELTDWNDVKLLTVKVDRLQHWHCPGLLCIGDAAHAMSPIGGVGINLAIQDAVAAANRLAPILQHRAPTEFELHDIQRRREWPTKMTQRLQVLMQNRLITRALAGNYNQKVPLPFRLIRLFPFLRRLTARLLGVGFRPEHVRVPT
jgi:2-polyprenyl-6-methoxyphenol hydroxylase-like FAD-dependent oxidoreductase